MSSFSLYPRDNSTNTQSLMTNLMLAGAEMWCLNERVYGNYNGDDEERRKREAVLILFLGIDFKQILEGIQHMPM